MELNERLKLIIDHLKLSPSQFADKLQIQRSAVSHLVAGRNKPGFSFFEKVIEVFPEINITWLITGQGNMLNSTGTGSSVPETRDVPQQKNLLPFDDVLDNEENENNQKESIRENEDLISVKKEQKIKKIILIFEDETFQVLEQKN